MLNEMSHTKSTALERLVMKLLGGLNRFYGIPTLALGLGVVHTRRFRKTVGLCWILVLSQYLICDWMVSNTIYVQELIIQNVICSTLTGLKPLWFRWLSHYSLNHWLPRNFYLRLHIGPAIAMIPVTKAQLSQ